MEEQVVPILHVQNAAAAVTWYERLGFRKEWEHRFEPHLPVFVSILKGTVRIYLSEHQGDARPDTLVYLWVRDVFSIAKDFQAQVNEQPWAHEITLTDPDGNRLRIGTSPA